MICVGEWTYPNPTQSLSKYAFYGELKINRQTFLQLQKNLYLFYFAGDGACFCWSAKLLRHGRSEEVTSWELIGPDYDPVYSICRSANTVHSACRDKTIRKYILKKSELPT